MRAQFDYHDLYWQFAMLFLYISMITSRLLLIILPTQLPTTKEWDMTIKNGPRPEPKKLVVDKSSLLSRPTLLSLFIRCQPCFLRLVCSIP